ncbi:MAG: hypothetical protein SWE60_04105 [Thermodesulfobacteriota bacterium]|nr:hypothetical protein [Thermodesulfobacteriota bacterium]
MVMQSNETKSLNDAIEKARGSFAGDQMHRYVVVDSNGVYHIVTLEDVSIGGRYASYPTVFSTFQ